ncbi:hypothetical protein GEI7407_3746 [Geitlerinema sp. PCC 7407]|nr:hypothetical protein GEI7407_3746 [Geitlerinema sp. PCC 7407]
MSMRWHSAWSALLALPLVMGAARGAIAAPDGFFSPYMAQIQEGLPAGFVMRLPAEVLLGGPASFAPEEMTVRILSSQAPPDLTVGLFTCTSGPMPCLVGSFSADRQGDPDAEAAYRRHVAAAAPLTLSGNIKGYLLEGGGDQPSPFSSLMWKQDSMIYTASFLASERQNLLRMAVSMANSPPIRPRARSAAAQ